MKLLISFLMLIYGTKTYAEVIIVTYSADQSREAQRIGELMTKAHNIPDEFIELIVSTAPCNKIRQRVSWHLCVDTHGNLQEVTVDPRFIEETLRIYL